MILKRISDTETGRGEEWKRDFPRVGPLSCLRNSCAAFDAFLTRAGVGEGDGARSICHGSWQALAVFEQYRALVLMAYSDGDVRRWVDSMGHDLRLEDYYDIVGLRPRGADLAAKFSRRLLRCGGELEFMHDAMAVLLMEAFCRMHGQYASIEIESEWVGAYVMYVQIEDRFGDVLSQHAFDL